MIDDLIKRAREAAEPWDYGEPDTLITELADRIEAQAAEIEKLREALRDVTPPPHFGESEQHKAWWAKARAALGEQK